MNSRISKGGIKISLKNLAENKVTLPASVKIFFIVRTKMYSFKELTDFFFKKIKADNWILSKFKSNQMLNPFFY